MSELIQSILSVIVVANLILGLVIFSRGYRLIGNFTFGLISIVTAIWGIAIIGFYSDIYNSLINWVVITHISALIIPILFLLFSVNFPKKIVNDYRSIFISIIPSIILICMILFTDTVIGETIGKTYKINIGYLSYCFILVSYFFISFLFLIKQFKNASNFNEKKQIQYVLIGTIVSSVLAILPDLILPFIGVYEFTWLGPVFTMMMVISFFLGMLRYKLFNIKIILTEIVSVIIVISLLIEIFYVKSY